MLKLLSLLMALSICAGALATETTTQLPLTCEDFDWGDVETLVQPYLDDDVYVALVMQSQSSEYHTSAAAQQVLNEETLPEPIIRLLTALVDARC
ncbi:hypothetical protein DXV75_02180 [Alteromonas aestuariivivens]|uniref:Uncharacterized protein n=1 Tax=Alteromonas aestuariivivens TaxID=1938339 RepID=A0A3D8MEN4_9ALTE|nr:hypothetical protein [Alteromonas aestuariivivens]RDV29285.1 hypothetical protein DXV75_02180 [Alteromonas aestuariivivens]